MPTAARLVDLVDLESDRRSRCRRIGGRRPQEYVHVNASISRRACLYRYPGGVLRVSYGYPMGILLVSYWYPIGISMRDEWL